MGPRHCAVRGGMENPPRLLPFLAMTSHMTIVARKTATYSMNSFPCSCSAGGDWNFEPDDFPISAQEAGLVLAVPAFEGFSVEGLHTDPPAGLCGWPQTGCNLGASEVSEARAGAHPY
eukprot:3373888-Amphidinium_carterae.1